jgi:hypothetical protein
MRYVTTERRGMSRKEPGPQGLRRRGPIGCVAPRSRRGSSYAPSPASLREALRARSRLATGPAAPQPHLGYN